MRIAGQDGGPWRGKKVHIIYGYIYLLKGHRIWSKTRLIIKKTVAKGRIRTTPGIKVFEK